MISEACGTTEDAGTFSLTNLIRFMWTR